MKITRTLTVIAIVYLLINLLFYWHATTLNGGTSIVYIFIFPFFWAITIILVIVLSIKNRKLWFQKKQLLSTLIALFFCTPVPLSLTVLVLRPPYYLAASGSNQENGSTIRFEEWNYYSGKQAITKYWKDEQKDSVWVYFDKKGDTISTETYTEDKLISKKIYK
jgi:hypothetical protein